MLSTEGGGRYDASTTNTYTPNIQRPEKRASGGRRTAIKILLCLLLPPIGIAYIWRTGSFRTRGRVLTTVLAFASMIVMILPTIQTPALDTLTPSNPSTPTAATSAPETNIATALSNIEELLMQQELAEAAELSDGEMAPAIENARNDTSEDDLERQNEAIYETIVYSVNSGAKFYHTGPTCGSQSNKKQLTVRQALNSGLGACATCNPPMPLY